MNMWVVSWCIWACLHVLTEGMERSFVQDVLRLSSPSLRNDKLGVANSRKNNNRHLDSGDDDWTSYLVDRNGNPYEPYSLAWRYLGMYMDCDVEKYAQEDGEQDGVNRFLEDHGNDNCQRTLLWAAYVDPRYKGGSIGEYQFYNLATEQWDKSTCQTRRCARMDCHEPSSHFKLVGVFKETDGLYDWAEQLFKHEGYCVWGAHDNDGDNDEGSGDNDEDDVYEFMSGRLERWPSSCIQLKLPDSYGNALYSNILPQAEGNITMGVFSDEYCSQVSTTTTFYDYVLMYYTNYYYSSDYGQQEAEKWLAYTESWNKNMDIFKICQPCRAYSLTVNANGGQEHRLLKNNENDGEGAEEQWGYNCYDDAGYTNVNQCYKFEVKTDLEPATVEDLTRASNQGTILEIKVNGRIYGSGGFGSTRSISSLTLTALVLGAGMLAGGLAWFILRRRRLHNNLKTLPPSFHENLHVEKSVSNDDSQNNASALRLLFSILSRQYQKRLPAPSFCANLQSSESEDVRPID